VLPGPGRRAVAHRFAYAKRGDLARDFIAPQLGLSLDLELTEHR
jgi:hypothetical protein